MIVLTEISISPLNMFDLLQKSCVHEMKGKIDDLNFSISHTSDGWKATTEYFDHKKRCFVNLEECFPDHSKLEEWLANVFLEGAVLKLADFEIKSLERYTKKKEE